MTPRPPVARLGSARVVQKRHFVLGAKHVQEPGAGFRDRCNKGFGIRFRFRVFWVSCFGRCVLGAVFRGSGSGLRVQVLRVWVGFGFRVFGFRVSGFGFRVSGSEFRGLSFALRVESSGV